jgi:hypothetical protein
MFPTTATSCPGRHFGFAGSTSLEAARLLLQAFRSCSPVDLILARE